MIDVYNITKFDRTEKELQEFILFCFLNHGKIAYLQAQKLEIFLQEGMKQTAKFYPFDIIRNLVEKNQLSEFTRHAKLGQYKYCVDPGFKAIAISNIDLKNCSTTALESIPGLSFKSSRYFILHSRPDQKIAVLDRHVLRWMRENGYPNAPQNPPQNYKVYKNWEDIFLSEATKRNLDIAHLDLEIWKEKAAR